MAYLEDHDDKFISGRHLCKKLQNMGLRQVPPRTRHALLLSGAAHAAPRSPYRVQNRAVVLGRPRHGQRRAAQKRRKIQSNNQTIKRGRRVPILCSLDPMFERDWKWPGNRAFLG
jgi:ribosomal protein L36